MKFSFLVPLAFLAAIPITVKAQADCAAGPSVSQPPYHFVSPNWDSGGNNMWVNPAGSAQIQLTTHFLKPGIDIKKYAKEYPATLKQEEVSISKKKEISVGPLKAYLMEGKQKVGSQISRMESISIFGEQLYFFTLISNEDAYKEAKACLESVVKTFQKN